MQNTQRNTNAPTALYGSGPFGFCLDCGVGFSLFHLFRKVLAFLP